jgi:hypothetical protein
MAYQFKNSDLEEIARLTAAGGGGGSPAGADGEIQYNESGSFGATSGFTISDTELFVNRDLKLQFSGQTLANSMVFTGVGSSAHSVSGTTSLIISYSNLFSSRNNAFAYSQSSNYLAVGQDDGEGGAKFIVRGGSNSSTGINSLFKSLDGIELFKILDDGFTNVNRAVQFQQEKFAVKSIGNSANAMVMFSNFDDDLIHGFYEDKYVMNGRHLTVGNVSTPAATIHAKTISTADESLRVDAINGQVQVVNVRDHLGTTLLGVKTNGEIQIDTGALPTATNATHSIPITVSGVGYYLLAYLQNP